MQAEVAAAAVGGGKPLKIVEGRMQGGGGWSVKQVNRAREARNRFFT